ncbi:hypothetical protein SMSP2_01050 [Limihaloglobus sulfuriphilus]|uniref:Uncharacterized protein n=1 Tax=Limihaloglobus sulfuriphilus TaxID=1851148 RepID=A0A1Q2MEM7_9BACT|nr:hypothetical protein SMSP2_01050 [Limihaloglobus sulfuriphilus]
MLHIIAIINFYTQDSEYMNPRIIFKKKEFIMKSCVIFYNILIIYLIKTCRNNISSCPGFHLIGVQAIFGISYLELIYYTVFCDLI